MTPAERFWAKVDKSGDCWLWLAGCFTDGYGAFGFERKLWRAHRWIYTQTFGAIPEGKVVMHSCDTPKCVNPSHLSLGTPQENARDMCSKGRNIWQRYPQKVHVREQRGEANASAKWTESDVKRMRELYKSGVSQGKIAKEYKTSQGAISAIVNRKHWTHV